MDTLTPGHKKKYSPQAIQDTFFEDEDGQWFQIIDTPGWFDPLMLDQQVMSEMKRFPDFAPHGLDLILFVINLSPRLQMKNLRAWKAFTQEFEGAEANTILALTRMGSIGKKNMYSMMFLDMMLFKCAIPSC